jgi:ectoine hydroxylase-related dioxygenase (phytanoyl-CoA dioxygenase family)
MQTYTAETYDANVIVHELLDGAGAVRFTGLFTPDQIAQARAIIMDHSNADAQKVTHFQGDAEADGKIALQRRVWNLLAKGDVFSDMAAHPVLMDVIGKFLGSEFVMGSIAANRILPGGPGQEPHVDYPYWDMHALDTHPTRLNATFPVNCQVTIMLDPFTEETGATAYMPGTQKELRYPNDADNFYDHAERMLGDAGDVVIFFGAAWHCAMPNLSQQDRTAVLSLYVPKWVKPLEDMPAALSQDFKDNASAQIRQLIGLNHPYPEVLDTADAVNAEGRK